MTDREIIQALECCKNDFSNSNCLDCPYNKEKSAKCITFMIEDALALILRQQAEIERLTIKMNAFGWGMKQEKERADTIRAEAIKEFAERLKDILATEVTVEYEISDGFFKDFFDITETFIEIDNLVKEMVGEDK